MARIGIDATALPSRPVGAGRYIIQLIRTLAALEPEEELIVFAYPDGRELIDVPEREGFRWAILPAKSPARRLLWEQTLFPRVAGEYRLDLLHSLHYTRPRWLPCASVVTFHDMTFFLYPQLHTRARRLFFPPAIRFSARHADALLTISESTRRDAIRLLNIPPEKIFATQLGVDASFRPVADPDARAAVRRRYDLPETFILYVGLVEPRKNLPVLIRALRSLADWGLSYPLVIAGRFGWMYQQVLAEIEALDLKENVRFLGYVPQADLPIVYNLACCFVYPTLYEGFGFPALEALACGTPLVTTAVSSLPEIVGEAGLLVPPGDEGALAAAVQAVITDAGLRARLAQEGPKRASQFAWERTAQQTLQVYRRVLEANRPA
jgi:glycosyltransferase involved in cell wall biosynthesis